MQMTPAKSLLEISTVVAMGIIAAVPWGAQPMFPIDQVFCSLIGAALAIAMIPVNNRTVSIVVTTGVAGIGLSLLFTSAALEYFHIDSLAYARAISGIFAFAAMPVCGLGMKLLDQLTNSSGGIGAIMEFIYSRGKLPMPPTQPPATGRTLPPNGGGNG